MHKKVGLKFSDLPEITSSWSFRLLKMTITNSKQVWISSYQLNNIFKLWGIIAKIFYKVDFDLFLVLLVWHIHVCGRTIYYETPIGVLYLSNVFPNSFGRLYQVWILTLRRPTCQSWHIKVFFSSHGSAWTAMSKRWKNIPFIKTLRILWKYCQYHRIMVEVIIILWNFFRKIIVFMVFTYF